MSSDIEFLEVVYRLREGWADLLGRDAEELARWLAEADPDDPESVRHTVHRVLDLLDRHPAALERVSGVLGIEGDLGALRSVFEKETGSPDEIPATTLMVCPQNPAHYRVRLRQKGQTLFCPQHDGVELVPKDSLPRKE